MASLQDTFPADGVRFDIAVKLAFFDGDGLTEPYADKDYHIFTTACRENLPMIRKLFLDFGHVEVTDLKQGCTETTITVQSKCFEHFSHFIYALNTGTLGSNFQNYVFNKTDFLSVMGIHASYYHLIFIKLRVPDEVIKGNFTAMCRSAQTGNPGTAEEGASVAMETNSVIKNSEKRADDSMDPHAINRRKAGDEGCEQKKKTGSSENSEKSTGDPMDPHSSNARKTGDEGYIQKKTTGSSEGSSSKPAGVITSTSTHTAEKQTAKQQLTEKSEKASTLATRINTSAKL